MAEQAKRPLVGIIMGSDSDLPVMSEAAQVCEEFGVPYEVSIVSAHRTPERRGTEQDRRSRDGVGAPTVDAWQSPSAC